MFLCTANMTQHSSFTESRPDGGFIWRCGGRWRNTRASVKHCEEFMEPAGVSRRGEGEMFLKWSWWLKAGVQEAQVMQASKPHPHWRGGVHVREEWGRSSAAEMTGWIQAGHDSACQNTTPLHWIFWSLLSTTKTNSLFVCLFPTNRAALPFLTAGPTRILSPLMLAIIKSIIRRLWCDLVPSLYGRSTLDMSWLFWQIISKWQTDWSLSTATDYKLLNVSHLNFQGSRRHSAEFHPMINVIKMSCFKTSRAKYLKSVTATANNKYTQTRCSTLIFFIYIYSCKMLCIQNRPRHQIQTRSDDLMMMEFEEHVVCIQKVTTSGDITRSTITVLSGLHI